jgi:predicted transcriptional regulator
VLLLISKTILQNYRRQITGNCNIVLNEKGNNFTIEKLILKIKKLGFKEYEAKIFLALLKNVFLSASEIADKAKVRRTAVYEILKGFAEKGY